MKSCIDTRDGKDVISSRIGICRGCITVMKEDNLFDIISDYKDNNPDYKDLSWVMVDECQFLDEEQIDQLAMVVDELDVNVMCYGLRTDFTSHFFDGSRRLMEIADTVTEIKSLCDCGRKAIVNARVDGNGFIINRGEQIMIGGDDKYIPLCRHCYNKALNATAKAKEDVIY